MERKLTIVKAIRETLIDEMKRDERILLLGEDIAVPGGSGGPFGVTQGFEEMFGSERVINTPISEIAIIGAAVGAAMMGMRPIAEVQYGDFIFCAMDQVVNQAAKMCYMSGGQVSVPMVIVVPTGATTRGAQHAQSPESFLIHIPGIKVVAPSNAYDAKGLFKTALDDENPVVFLEHKRLMGSKGIRKAVGGVDTTSDVPEETYSVSFGKGKIVREGRDVTIIGKLLTVHKALQAAEKLAKEGIECEVIDPRSLVPFDLEMLLNSIKKTGRLVIVDECNFTGGWAGEIAALIAEHAVGSLDAPIQRVTAPDTPVPFAPVLENEYVPQANKIIEAVKSILEGTTVQ